MIRSTTLNNSLRDTERKACEMSTSWIKLSSLTQWAVQSLHTSLKAQENKALPYQDVVVTFYRGEIPMLHSSQVRVQQLSIESIETVPSFRTRSLKVKLALMPPQYLLIK